MDCCGWFGVKRTAANSSFDTPQWISVGSYRCSTMISSPRNDTRRTLRPRQTTTVTANYTHTKTSTRWQMMRRVSSALRPITLDRILGLINATHTHTHTHMIAGHTTYVHKSLVHWTRSMATNYGEHRITFSMMNHKLTSHTTNKSIVVPVHQHIIISALAAASFECAPLPVRNEMCVQCAHINVRLFVGIYGPAARRRAAFSSTWHARV